MRFDPIAIGIVPEPGPDRMGYVGMPVWMWVQDPSPATWGPQERSLSSGGVTVTSSAKVTSIRWEMGDRGVVNCLIPGKAYEDRFGLLDSPSCGYKYSREGTYQVNAFTNWTATWRASTGEQGVFTWRVGSSTTINIGELQVINR